LQIAADMRLARASPAARNPARLGLILNAHWNNDTMTAWHGRFTERWPRATRRTPAFVR
jgi:hypothetical protein